jgi:hypothetical protein
MTPPEPQRPTPLPPTDELEARMHALLKLRRQMLELHARLEYLRLMLRVSGPTRPLRRPSLDGAA